MRHIRLLAAIVLTTILGCGQDDNPATTEGSGSSSGGGSVNGSNAASTGASQGGSTTTSSTGVGGGGDIPGGGTILFQEPFDDTNFMARGWYDGPAGIVTATGAVMGSAFDCHFMQSATSCADGKPARHKFTDSETVYLSFHLKFSANWVGSGVSYHPHMFHFLTNVDGDFIGPASTHLTTYTEIVQGRAMLALQDSLNVDNNCILRNDDTFVGCNGNFSTYVFTENRSVCSCNGLVGDLDGRDCFNSGYWYSSRSWRSPMPAFGDGGPPFDKANWHFVEVYFAMNTIQNGVGVPDGRIRWVQDGQTLISSDNILLRTATNATLAFNQFAMLPYIGPGSPVDQNMYVDELTVATARP